jgi:hypothetical protein
MNNRVVLYLIGSVLSALLSIQFQRKMTQIYITQPYLNIGTIGRNRDRPGKGSAKFV